MAAGRRSPLTLVAGAAGAVAVAAALGLVVLALLRPEPAPQPSEPLVAADESGIEHVHGLGVNPADGTLHVATHFGLWRLPEDEEPERVGDAYHDLMGFTVLGADRFVASGHPDLDTDWPVHLGLIESTDGGVSWELVSLQGEADFHALTVAHDRLYGVDATGGRVLVSDDAGRTWDERAQDLAVRDLAVSPDDADLLLATSPDGLLRSDDGGVTWRQVSAEPLVLLAWDESGLWAVDEHGALLRGAEAGEAWEPVADIPEPPAPAHVHMGALLHADGVLYFAPGGAAVYASHDEGATWKRRA